MNDVGEAERITFANREGDSLNCYRWTANQPNRATLVYIHGMNGSPFDAEPLAKFLQTQGIETFAWGLRGQGLDPNPDRRAIWMDVIGHLNDLEDVMRAQGAMTPIFVSGESLGGLLTLRAAVEKRITAQAAGFISIVPVLAVAQENPKWTRDVAAFLAKHFPRARLNASWLIHGRRRLPIMTSNEQRQHEMEAAPHRSQAVGLQMLVNIADLMSEATAAAEKIAVPLAVIDGGIDVFVKAETVKAFTERVKSPDFTHYHYPEANHLVLWEKEGPEICRTIGDWISQRIDASGNPTRNQEARL